MSSDLLLYQVDLWETDLQSSLELIAEWDGFQDPLVVGFTNVVLGPDCRMYVGTGSGSFHLGVIYEPDLKGQQCLFVQHDLVLPSPKSRGSMPNFPHFRIDEDQPCDRGITLSDREIAMIEDNRIQVYPNPSDDQVTFLFKTPLTERMELRIYDALGMEQIKHSIRASLISSQIDVSSLSSGIYYYHLVGKDTRTISGSFVKKGR